MPQQPSLARQQVMRLAGCGPYLAIRYGGRAARRVRHLVAEGNPSPRPIKRLQRGSKPRQRTRRTAAGWANCPSRPPSLFSESKGPNWRKRRTFLCVMHERGIFEWGGLVIPLVGATRSRARLLCELSNWTSLSRMGVFPGQVRVCCDVTSRQRWWSRGT